MKEISPYLEDKLQLRVNLHKSAIDRPCVPKFLGYNVIAHELTKLKTSDINVSQSKGKSGV